MLWSLLLSLMTITVSHLLLQLILSKSMLSYPYLYEIRSRNIFMLYILFMRMKITCCLSHHLPLTLLLICSLSSRGCSSLKPFLTRLPSGVTTTLCDRHLPYRSWHSLQLVAYISSSLITLGSLGSGNMPYLSFWSQSIADFPLFSVNEWTTELMLKGWYYSFLK